MLMDDVGNLFWRFGRKLLVTTGEKEHAPADHKPDRKEPTKIVHSPAAE